MKRSAAILTATASLMISGAVAAGGCGFGPGEASTGEAHLRVTRDFGSVRMVDATLDGPTPSDTVVRFLDENADVETSYGGNFVDSIGGFAGSTSGGDDEDWFFFVNGYYSDIGAGETRVLPGDRIWWDYRYWSAAYRVPAVVGSFPEPFLNGYQGERFETIVECLTAEDVCDSVVSALEEEGVEPRIENVRAPVEHPEQLRVLVGPWGALRDDRAARQLESGPERSGVYGRFAPCGEGWQLEIDDPRGDAAHILTDAGLIAAVREGQDQPTWVITGTGDAAVLDAADNLGAESLGDRYAVAIAAGEELPLPAGQPADAAKPTECG